ncbi:ABC transporter ATP-binding protein [Maribacter chungangensis]|uniref:ABC transporter ATP-binding protein n=1 Tax=Maribacter chungangensis TaxID=1069117 RepID=A0ABW3B4Q7_9FLAO
MEETQATITVHELAIGYKSMKIAGDINFSLQKGELCAIVGINGIGKSTLLRTLGNVQPKLSGNILIDSSNVEKYTSLQLAAQLSVVLTEPLASKNLTALELISLGRLPYTNWLGTLEHKDKVHIQNCVQQLDLQDLQHKHCFELSDGQLQRVLIARAVAQDTPIILLDEPTTHLDLYHKVQIFKLLKGLTRKHQKTVLFTTHEIDLAIQLCDKILILDGTENPVGQPCELIEKGAFDQLFPSDMIAFDAITGTFKVKN